MDLVSRPSGQQPVRHAIPAQRDSSDGPRLVLRGELDVANVRQTQVRLDEMAGRGARVVEVDVQEVTFLDLTTLRVLLQTDQTLRARGGRLRLVNASGRVRRLLRITRTEHLLGSDRAQLSDD